MIVIVSTNTFSAREPDHSASTKPIEITSYRPPASTPSSVGLMMLLTVCGVSACDDEVQDGVAHLPHLGVAEAREDVADRTGQGEDQRRQREHREEGRLGREPRHAVAHAGADGGDDQPPERVADPDQRERPGTGFAAALDGHGTTVRPCRSTTG